MVRRWRRRPAQSADVPTPTLEGYQDLEVVGRGASATVYRAAQAGYDRHVAIKVFHVDISDRRGRRRFDRERAVSGRLSHHPNVVTVLESGLIDGRQPYLAMELYEHGSLADTLSARGPFTVDRVLHLAIRVAGALESAHRLGVLHRDIKPENILLSRFGEPALADFGIAAILEADPVMTAALTPSHAAPELLEGADPTAQSDIYALTSSIYTLLTGRPPFAGPDGEGVLAQLLRVTTGDVPTVPRADVPASLQDLLNRGLAKTPDLRAASALDLGIELQAIQGELGLPETPLPVESLPSTGAAATESQTASVATGGNGSVAQGTIESTTSAPSNGPILEFSEPSGEPPDPGSLPAEPTPAGDLTVGLPPRAATVVGRQAVASRPPAAEPGRRWLRLVVSVGAVLVGVGAVVGGSWLVNRGDDQTSLSSKAQAASPLTDEDLEALAPTGVVAVAAADGEGIVVRWTDNSDGRYNFVVRATMVDDSESLPTTAQKGTAAAKLDVDPNRVECITVAALVSFGEPSVLAPSEPYCI